MKIRKFVIALALPFMFSSFLLAQETPQKSSNQVDRATRHAQMLAELKQELALTPDQEAKVKKVLDERAAEMKTQRDARQQNMEAKRSERSEKMNMAQEKQKEHNAKMKEILTAEQYVKYLEIRQSRQGERQGERQGNRQGEGKPGRKMMNQ